MLAGIQPVFLCVIIARADQLSSEPRQSAWLREIHTPPLAAEGPKTDRGVDAA